MPIAINPKKILISPLDWGLGHATRCIPLIDLLLKAGHKVLIAAAGPSAALLQKEFPGCLHLDSPSANFIYSRSRWLFPLYVIAQIPKLNRLSKEETRWLQDIVEKQQVNLIISDNRFGMYHPDVPSVFMSHQLGLKTGFGRQADLLIQQWKFSLLNHFTECWVPDLPGNAAIAGELSNPVRFPKVPVHYIGLLSRFTKTSAPEEGRLLVMLSGPEPQRSMLEDIINKQLSGYRGKVIVVRGLPETERPIAKVSDVTYYAHLPAARLNEEVNQAEFIICRSGYSSVMDLLKLRKKGIYVPTPGQTEQEYLGKRIETSGYGVVCSQKDFNLDAVIKKAAAYNYQIPEISNSNVFLQRVEALLYAGKR